MHVEVMFQSGIALLISTMCIAVTCTVILFWVLDFN